MMAPTRASLALAATILLLGGPRIGADDGKTDREKKAAQPTAGVKPEAPPSAERAKAMLRDATTLIQSLADEAARRERKFEIEPPADFVMRFTRSRQADVLEAIGRAQARLGDPAAARASWQSALDAAATPSALDVMPDSAGDRVAMFIGIVEAQLEAGDRDEARFTIRQALQAIRTTRPGPALPFEPPPGMGDGSDRLAGKAHSQGRLAQLQARAGEAVAAAETLRQAIEAAGSIGDPAGRIRALIDLAGMAPPEQAEPLWTKALDFAMAQEERPRAHGVEAVLRARVLAGQVDTALATIDDRLKGDLRSYGLWVVGDAIAAGDMAVRPESIERLYQLVLKAEFNRASKRFKTFRRIAEAQARLGDYEAAYRTVGQPQADAGAQSFLARQARAYVMAAVARAQLGAGRGEAARDTAHAALELINAQPDNEGVEAVLPIVELGDLLARAGDIAGALGVAESVANSTPRVRVFADIAAAQARAGKLDDARRTIRRAVEAAATAPNEAIWNTATFTGGADSSPLDPTPRVREAIAEAYASMGDLDDCFLTISRMGADPFSSMRRTAVIEKVVGLRLEADDLAGARRAADLISHTDLMSQDERVELQGRIAEHQARRHDPAPVLDWARQEKAPRVRLRMLRGLADGIAERFKPRAQPSKPGDPSSPAQPRPAGP